MDESYKSLPFDQLRILHREIGALIAQRRHEALEQLREQASILGFTADDLAPKKQRKNAARRYHNPDDPDNVWNGKGRKPTWLKDALAAGRTLDEFEVSA